MKIIFMGTPEFAIPALQAIISSKNHQVVAVFTQAPKPKGRGMEVLPSPVNILANQHNIPVYTPKTLRNDEAGNLVNSIIADIIVVVAYGFIIPAAILNAKKYGCLNIHPSKLPKYRGAAPLQRTIINGEKETAICVMQMDEGLDTGDIILQEDFILDPQITLIELHDKCAKIGGDLLIKVLDNIENLPKIKQGNEGVCYAHKLSKEESRINWHESAYTIDCKIRGMTPWPGVHFIHNEKEIKIISASYKNINEYKNTEPGELLNDKFEIACGSGILKIDRLKPAGKQEMLASDYLRGIKQQSKKIIFS